MNKDYTISEKLNFMYEGKHNLINGICLILVSVISLLFDQSISTLAVKYLLPLAILILSLKYLYLACKHKELKIENYCFLLIGSILFILIDLFLLFIGIESKQNFIVISGIMILLTSLLDILSKDKSLFNIINFLIVVTLGTVTVVFKGLLLQNYLYLLIGLLSLGIIDSTIGLIKVTKYKKKKINQDNEDKKDNKSIKKNTKKRKK